MIACLEELVTKDETHRGTLSYIKMMRTYVECFVSTSMSYVDRVENLAYVVGYIRYWNVWLAGDCGSGITRKRNGLTAETCTDVEMSAAVAIALIGACGDHEKFGCNLLDLSRLVRHVCCRVNFVVVIGMNFTGIRS